MDAISHPEKTPSAAKLMNGHQRASKGIFSSSAGKDGGAEERRRPERKIFRSCRHNLTIRQRPHMVGQELQKGTACLFSSLSLSASPCYLSRPNRIANKERRMSVQQKEERGGVGGRTAASAGLVQLVHAHSPRSGDKREDAEEASAQIGHGKDRGWMAPRSRRS